jgi:zinc protease
MVEQMKPADVQRMAQQLLAAKRCIEVTMLSE